MYLHPSEQRPLSPDEQRMIDAAAPLARLTMNVLRAAAVGLTVGVLALGVEQVVNGDVIGVCTTDNQGVQHCS